jgi:hypothetical protein
MVMQVGSNVDSSSKVFELLNQYYERLQQDLQKKTQDNEFFLDLQLYEELKAHIIQTIIKYIATEKTAREELEKELQKNMNAQNEWVAEEYAILQEKNDKYQQEVQQLMDSANQLKKELGQQIELLKDLIVRIKKELKEQENKFFEYFYEEMKANLLAKYGNRAGNDRI